MSSKDEEETLIVRMVKCKNCGYEDDWDSFPWESPDGFIEHSKFHCPKCGSWETEEYLKDLR